MRANQLTLYSYWRSSAAYRVRIALNLKGLPYQAKAVHLVRNGPEHLSESYRSINPQAMVPVLIHNGQVLTQSMAICEYLDECFEAYPLLPADPLQRARVRSLALQIACDIHPLNNLRVQKYLEVQCGDSLDRGEWMNHWVVEGFAAIEQHLGNHAGSESGFFCERPGGFECFLIPQVYNAERFGTDMAEFPALSQIVTLCRAMTAFQNAAPENQADADPL